MPNITRGERMSGLIVYLAGPGRANEHTEPHLVAGDSAVMAWHDDSELSRDDALRIARELDQPRRAYGVTVPRSSARRRACPPASRSAPRPCRSAGTARTSSCGRHLVVRHASRR